jgi:hypothetical protein
MSNSHFIAYHNTDLYSKAYCIADFNAYSDSYAMPYRVAYPNSYSNA